MDKLANYVSQHTTRLDSAQSEGPRPPGLEVDLIFFKLSVSPEADPGTLRELVQAHKGDWCEADLFDGNEHSYLQIGGWAGDQGLALSLMGMGAALGLWRLHTPRSVLGNALPEGLIRDMAGQGFITIQAVKA